MHYCGVEGEEKNIRGITAADIPNDLSYLIIVVIILSELLLM